MRIPAQVVAAAFVVATTPVDAFTALSTRAVVVQPTSTRVFSTTVEAPSQTTKTSSPPTEEQEAYGTVVGDTKGAALRLENVAITRGASPLLQNIDWSVQPNERWGIVGVNGAGYDNK